MSRSADAPLPFGLTAEEMWSVLKSLAATVFTLDLEHRITAVNHLTPGLTDAQVIGVPALAFIPPEFHDVATRAFDEVARTGKPTIYETRGPSLEEESGFSWYAVYVGAVLRDGEVVALTLVSEEISARKRLEAELRASIERLEAYSAELEEKNRRLAAENADRQRAEAALGVQQEMVRSMSTPIIQAWDGVLVLPIVGSLDRGRASQVMERLLAEIVQTQSRFAVLDLTGVDTVDTETVGHLLAIVRAASLLGSRCLVSGISPAIAQTMVGLGGAESLTTFAQLQDALRHALIESGVQAVAGRPRRA